MLEPRRATGLRSVELGSTEEARLEDCSSLAALPDTIGSSAR